MLFDGAAGVAGVDLFVVAYKDSGPRGEAVVMRVWWRNMKVTVMTRRGRVAGAILSCELCDAPMSGFGMIHYQVWGGS